MHRYTYGENPINGHVVVRFTLVPCSCGRQSATGMDRKTGDTNGANIEKNKHLHQFDCRQRINTRARG